MKVKFFLFALLLNFSTSSWAQTTGFLDTTFNKTGPLKGKKDINIGGGARLLAVDDQGRAVVAACSTTYGSLNLYIYRLKTDGMLDVPFGGNNAAVDTVSKVLLSAYGASYGGCFGLVLQKDGKILICGQVVRSSNTDMFVLRLRSNGIVDSTFGVNGFWMKDYAAGVDEAHDIALQSDGKIIVSGRSSNKMRIVRLNSDGTDDITFLSYLSTNTNSETPTGLDILNDTIVACGTANNTYPLVKLLSDGTPVWATIRKDIATPYDTYDNSAHLSLLPNGKIIIGGYTYSKLKMIKLNSDGTLDNTFASSGTFAYLPGVSFPSLTSFIVESDGKITMSGHASNNYVILRIDRLGNMDNNFGTSGKVLINTGSAISNKSALSKDGRLLLTGDENPKSAVLKVYLKPVMHILGNAFILPKSVEVYKVQVPAAWTTAGATYSWTYSDMTAVQFLPPAGSNGQSVTLFYGDSAKAGTLICTATGGGVIIGVEKLDIVINTNPNNASELADLQCPAELTECSGSYIDYFSLNLINNDSSGCSGSGYSDFTQSNLVDTFAVGGVYSAIVRVEGSDVKKYIGIWIDYNNDGKLNGADEFVAEKYSDVSVIEVHNIVFKNAANYDGAKRLRIRCRPDAAFTASDACQNPGDLGETEDYLIVLTAQKQLEAPEIITPNDDGKNDYFVVRGVNPAAGNKLYIFDRWGQEKFFTDNYENNWSGTNKNGEKLVPGTYYYLFTNNNESVRGFLEIRY